jgi:cytochrome d ubiquinol oxidase subunit II
MQPHDATAWAMLASLVLYVLTGGADFGAGVWDLLARGPRKQRQRARIAAAIGPIWEANHVWLVLLVVLLFTGFPAAFAALMTALHVPVTLVLLGIVARGSTFVFRSYAPEPAARRRYGLVFSLASLATPLLLGVVLGTAASGRLAWQDGAYVSGWFAPWLAPFPWAVGLLALAMSAYLAAVYLCVEVDEDDLRADFRARALVAAGAVAVAAAAALLLAPRLATPLADDARTLWFVLGTAAVALAAFGASWRRRHRLARALAALECTLIVAGYGLAVEPWLIVPQWTIEATAAPERTHELVLLALGAGALVLFPSLWWLLRVFKGRRAFALRED